jgi:type II secretory pathway component PulF
LLFARNEVEQGSDAWSSLRDAKLLTAAEANAINVASATETRSWIMRRLAGLKREDALRKSAVLVQWFQTLAIIGIAAIVLAIVATFFSFITGVIYKLA